TRLPRTGLVEKKALIDLSLGNTALVCLMPRSSELYAKPLPETAFLVDAAARSQPQAWSDQTVGTLVNVFSRLKERDQAMTGRFRHAGQQDVSS
ncbi:MAG: phytoene synthase, partial [Pseudomonadota bacterium]